MELTSIATMGGASKCSAHHFSMIFATDASVWYRIKGTFSNDSGGTNSLYTKQYGSSNNNSELPDTS